MNLTEYLPADHRSWIPAYAERMGWERLTEYYNRVFLRLLGMKPMEEFDVVQNVDPEHYELFLRCAVAAMREAHRCSGNNYFIENNATVILCR